MYYIAYGSNLNKEEMKQRCKDAKFVSLARLENYTLTYRGNPGRAYLTVDKKKGDFVRVAVWDVSENDKKSLDEYEDYPYLYDCFEEKVLLEKMKQSLVLSTKCIIVFQNVNRAIRIWNGANKAIVIWGGILQF